MRISTVVAFLVMTSASLLGREVIAQPMPQAERQARGVAPPPGGPPPDIATLRINPSLTLDEILKFPGLSLTQQNEVIRKLGPLPRPHPPIVRPTASKVLSTITVNGVKVDCVLSSSSVDTPPTANEMGLGSPDAPSQPPPAKPSGAIPQCPAGSVAIRHDQNQANAPRFDFDSKDHGRSGTSQGGSAAPLPALEPPHRYAHASANLDNRGVRSQLNVWSPRPLPGDMTLGQTWIVAYRPDGKPQTVESGWQVWEGWGTKYAVPFIYYTTNGYDSSEGTAKSGCYNVSPTCNAFVPYSSAIILGVPLPVPSSGGTEQTTLTISWFLKANGNWWVEINGIWLGYYPKATFANGPLAGGAQVIDFGGEATGWQATSEMGSGHYAKDGYGIAAFFNGIGYSDMSGKPLSVGSQQLTPSMSDATCYTIQFAGVPSEATTAGGSFFFGGPGTNHFGVDSTIPKPPPEQCHGPSR
jgi:Neprosin